MKEFQKVMTNNQPGTYHRDFIIQPMTAKLKLDVNMIEGDLRRPKVIIDFILTTCSIALNKNQYADIIALLNYISDFRSTAVVCLFFCSLFQYSKYRPSSDSNPQDDPETWWEYV